MYAIAVREKVMAEQREARHEVKPRHTRTNTCTVALFHRIRVFSTARLILTRVYARLGSRLGRG